jgi:hypothetical protein
MTDTAAAAAVAAAVSVAVTTAGGTARRAFDAEVLRRETAIKMSKHDNETSLSTPHI